MLPQLPLELELRKSASFDNFVGEANLELINQLCASAAAEGEQYLLLWGTSGSGKSHLLHACCHAANDKSKQAAYIPLADADTLNPDLLHNLDAFDLVCLDDIEQIGGLDEWELALFNLFNLLRSAGTRLVISAGLAPASLPIVLQDLRSRLEWGPSYQVQGLNDGEREQLLDQGAKQRGLELSPETSNYILARTSRDTQSLIDLLHRLDQASLAAQRKLTVPFVKSVLLKQPR